MSSTTAVPTVDVCVRDEDRRAALAADVRNGLTRARKSLPPVWFYDDRGSRLFDAITRLPEYYLTRAERAILAERAAEIVEISAADTLVELGSGTSEKTKLLLEAFTAAGALRQVILLDISEAVLREAAAAINADYGVEVHAVVGDFHRHICRIPSTGRQLWAFLGSTIGNLTPTARGRLLRELRTSMAGDSHLLLGTDLVKPTWRLLAAYDDSSGVTAAFNRNLLRVLNHELQADFDPGSFEHVASWNAVEERIEMRLRAKTRQSVAISDLGLTVEFAAGEDLLTEYSAKFRPERLRTELRLAGLATQRCWQDEAGDYQLTLARPER